MVFQVEEYAYELLRMLQPLVARIRRRDKSLADQLTRAASSIALNIAEANYSDPRNKRARLFTAAGSGADMPIARERRFLRWPDMRPAPGLGLESSRLEECVQEINRGQVMGVFGSPVFNFYESDLNVLTRIPHVEAIWFWDVDLKNIDGLYALDALRKFGVHPKRPAIDFSKLPKLKQLVWHHTRQDRGVSDLVALESLHSWRYRPRGSTFGGLRSSRARSAQHADESRIPAAGPHLP
jgi:23S rRNA-intervening sequence protein